MASFTIELKGLSQLREDFSQGKLNKQTIVAVGTEINKIHNALRFAVHSTYAIDKSLDSVLKGRSTSNVRQSGNFIEAGLTYEQKAIRLAEYPFKVKVLKVKNRMMLPDGTLRFASPTNKIVAKEYSVMVRRKGGYKEIYGKTGRGAFKTNKVPSRKMQLLERQQDATWKQEPIVRALYKPLYGPSLAQMAGRMLEEDRVVKTLIDNLDVRIAEALVI